MVPETRPFNPSTPASWTDSLGLVGVSVREMMAGFRTGNMRYVFWSVLIHVSREELDSEH